MKIATGLINSALMQKFAPKFQETVNKSVKNDSLEFSDTSKVMESIDDFLDLGKGSDITLSEMNEKERDEFIKVLTTLIENGIMGYEKFEVNGKRYKVFLTNQIGDKRLYNAEIKRVKDDE